MKSQRPIQSRRLAGLAAAVAAAFALAGCMSLAPPYQAPALELPADQPLAGPANAPRWWTTSGDPVLAALVEEALAHNRDLLVAAARIEQARAALGLARADQLPDAGLQVEANRSRDPVLFPQIINRFSTQLAVSYQLDFWGKYRDATAAAREQLIAAEANREALRLSLASELAQTWYGYQADTLRVAINERTLAAQAQELKLLRRRVAAGIAGEFELHQQEAEVAATTVTLQLSIGARERGRNALGILLGRTPKAQVDGALPEGGEIAGLPVPDSLPAGLPSQRLLNRPDVQAAEAALKAANAQIGVARAAWFPDVALTASGGSASRELSALFSGGPSAFAIGAALIQPLFYGGRIASGIDAAEADRDAAVARYRQTVSQAFREVLDALAARRTAQVVAQAEATRVAALGETLRLARLRYLSGLTSQFELLGNERSLLAAQGNLVEAKRGEAAAAVQLWTALGG